MRSFLFFLFFLVRALGLNAAAQVNFTQILAELPARSEVWIWR